MSIITDRIKYGKETIKNPLYHNEFSYGKVLVKDNCSGCGKCTEACLVKAISIKDSRAEVDFTRCIHCGNCIDICPEKALENSHDYRMAVVGASVDSDIDETEAAGKILREKIYSSFNRSLVLRSVDTGSCNACMIELSATQNNFYSLSRYGISFAASPRHADGIVITGPVTLNMKEALLKTYKAMAEPRLVIAVGTCAYDGGVFKDCYAVPEALKEILPVDLYIPGCPPSPQSIIYGFLKLLNRV